MPQREKILSLSGCFIQGGSAAPVGAELAMTSR
jgi:hypothetical protein